MTCTKILLLALVGTITANPVFVSHPIGLTANQYHAQDELGQYSFGYQNPNSARTEMKDFAGITRGSYSYVAPNGELITNNYIADENGFRSSLAPTDGNAGPITANLPIVPSFVVSAVHQQPMSVKQADPVIIGSAEPVPIERNDRPATETVVQTAPIEVKIGSVMSVEEPKLAVKANALVFVPEAIPSLLAMRHQMPTEVQRIVVPQLHEIPRYYNQKHKPTVYTYSHVW